MARKNRSATDQAMAKQIKDMEVKKKAAAAELLPKEKPVDNSISFDQWWMGLVRKCDIRPSYKEIIKADFAARGLKINATQEEFDKALELYGIKL